jgi:hypothetical protein
MHIVRWSPYVLALTSVLASGVGTAAQAQSTEYVVVQKALDDNAVIVRSNGTVYLIEKGVGCLSLWRYEGKRVIISSPGLFLGVGSRLLIPDASQECRIWSSKEVDTQLPSEPQARRSTPPAQPGATIADEFSLFNSQGKATAYLDTSAGLTFYLWTGEPVAYLDDDSIYGFNGKHLAGIAVVLSMTMMVVSWLLQRAHFAVPLNRHLRAGCGSFVP